MIAASGIPSPNPTLKPVESCARSLCASGVEEEFSEEASVVLVGELEDDEEEEEEEEEDEGVALSSIMLPLLSRKTPFPVKQHVESLLQQRLPSEHCLTRGKKLL